MGGDIWLPGAALETADGGDCSPRCVWLLRLAVLGAGVVFAPNAAVTIGLRVCMLKVSLRRSWLPRAVWRSLWRAHRSWRTNDLDSQSPCCSERGVGTYL